MFELETDPTKFCLVLTAFYRIKKTCCEEDFDTQRSAHERSLSGTRVSVSVIADEASRYHVRLSVRLSVRPSVRPSVRLSVCLSQRPLGSHFSMASLPIKS